MKEFTQDKEKALHKGHRQRVKKRFLKEGLDSFAEHEILELLLFYVIPQKDTNEIAHELLARFGSLDNVLSAKPHELCKVKYIKEEAATFLCFMGQLKGRIAVRPKRKILRDIEEAGEFCCELLKEYTEERLILISLNGKMDVLCVDTISKGDFSSTKVDIRKIVELALERRAVSVILAHNHPGDTPHPSDNDLISTGHIMSVLEGLGIEFTDHIVCSGDKFVSMSQRGMLDLAGD